MNGKVFLSDVTKLHMLFGRKNWFVNSNESSVFNNFCILLDSMSNDQKQLMYELTENYLWLSGTEYEKKFLTILKTVFNAELRNCAKIYLVPVLKISDRKKSKSAHHCVYLIRGLLSFNPEYREINVEVMEDFDILKAKEFLQDKTEKILFIDDFIGTGDTFMEGWNDIMSSNKSVTRV